MRVWVDVANPPQVRFFEPVVACLRDRGDEVAITARAHRETALLARDAWPETLVDGADSPRGRLRKAFSLGERALRLRRWASGARPDVAVSHNSYAQLVVAASARVPAVTAMDYEHQPANHLAFRLATLVVVPRVFPDGALRRFGATSAKVRRYDGLKEEMYLASQTEASLATDRPGLDAVRDGPFAVLRLPPDGALYHRNENAFVEAAVAALRARGLTVVVLGRSVDQRDAWRRRGEPGIIVAEPPIDTRALLRECELFVGAGGTMTREAALLGTPTYSIFAGTRAAADVWLAEQGRLTFLRSTEDLRLLREAPPERKPSSAAVRPDGPLETLLAALDEVVRR